MKNIDILNQNISDVINFLKRIIAIRSISGDEEELLQFLKKEFSSLCDWVQLLEIPENLNQNPLYSNVIGQLSYINRHNLLLKVLGTTCETIILNAHADVVSAADEMFSAYEKNGVVYGRGACDDKGQIAVIYLLLNLIRRSGIKPLKNLEIHIVTEEETGGNGTLAIMHNDMNASLAIVLEPTDLKILTANRGVLWFKAVVRGVSGHSGDVKSVKNALTTAVVLMDVLQDCHNKIFHRLKGAHPFEDFENPMPLTFGKFHSGDWPSVVPKVAVLEGVFGFLPGMSHGEVIDEIQKSISESDREIAGYVDISFPLQRDPNVTFRELPCIKSFAKSAASAGIQTQFSAFPAWCDAWFYPCLKGIPVIIFGAGKLGYAHSDKEQINTADIKSCALAIYNNIYNLEK